MLQLADKQWGRVCEREQYPFASLQWLVFVLRPTVGWA
jgi:hypothetical protein